MSCKVVISGAAGRMGRKLLVMTAEDEELELAGAIDYPQHPRIGESVALLEPDLGDTEVILSNCLDVAADVMIDFSLPEGTEKRIPEAVENKVALVIGTTGMSKAQEAQVLEASKIVPVIHASNYSLGINLLLKIAAEVAQILNNDFDIEITESHHNQKVDAPSGTALSLAKSICEVTGRDADTDLVFGREGRPGKRTRKEIGIHALRMGSVVGDHRVYFGNDYEIIELAHRSQSRDCLAAGAIRAAKWISGREPGMYSMEDVLFG